MVSSTPEPSSDPLRSHDPADRRHVVLSDFWTHIQASDTTYRMAAGSLYLNLYVA